LPSTSSPGTHLLPVTITVSVDPVAGENDSDNNSRKYPSNIFTP
jgi:hypothetical protein